MRPTIPEERCRCLSGLSGPVGAVVMGLYTGKEVPLASARADPACSNPAAEPNMTETVPLRNHMPTERPNWSS